MVRPGALPAATYLTGFYNSGTIVMVACIGPGVAHDVVGFSAQPPWVNPSRVSSSARPVPACAVQGDVVDDDDPHGAPSGTDGWYTPAFSKEPDHVHQIKRMPD